MTLPSPFSISHAVSALPVLLWERVALGDPSVPWMHEQGIDLRLGRPNSDAAYRRYVEADLIEDARGCVGLIGSGGARITRAVIDALPALRVISKIGVGVDNIDVAAAQARGIVVCHTPDEDDSSEVAEHALALLLALRRQLHVWTTERLRRGEWRTDSVFATGLRGSTLGIVGFGRIGRALARRLAGWEVRLLVHDPMLSPDAQGTLPSGVESVALDTLLASSDAVSLHCPALPDARCLIDARAIASMRPSAVLVNTARASLVDHGALVEALRNGGLTGAAIDVFEPEPPSPDDPLLSLPNVICTPHVASWTRAGFMRRRQRAAFNLFASLAGRPGAQVVGPRSVA